MTPSRHTYSVCSWVASSAMSDEEEKPGEKKRKEKGKKRWGKMSQCFFQLVFFFLSFFFNLWDQQKKKKLSLALSLSR